MSFMGNSFLSRCGYSINQNLSLTKLISKSYYEYVEKINYLEKNRIKLNEIRNYLLDNGKKLSLFNHNEFSNAFIEQINSLIKN